MLLMPLAPNGWRPQSERTSHQAGPREALPPQQRNPLPTSCSSPGPALVWPLSDGQGSSRAQDWASHQNSSYQASGSEHQPHLGMLGGFQIGQAPVGSCYFLKRIFLKPHFACRNLNLERLSVPEVTWRESESAAEPRSELRWSNSRPHAICPCATLSPWWREGPGGCFPHPCKFRNWAADHLKERHTQTLSP